jgi:hypothetical protein
VCAMILVVYDLLETERIYDHAKVGCDERHSSFDVYDFLAYRCTN